MPTLSQQVKCIISNKPNISLSPKSHLTSSFTVPNPRCAQAEVPCYLHHCKLTKCFLKQIDERSFTFAVKSFILALVILFLSIMLFYNKREFLSLSPFFFGVVTKENIKNCFFSFVFVVLLAHGFQTFDSVTEKLTISTSNEFTTEYKDVMKHVVISRNVSEIPSQVLKVGTH